MHRELLEELGAQASEATQVFLASFRSATGLHVHHFFVARLVGLDPALRTGPEFTDPARGAYDPDRVDLRGDDLANIDLRPPELKAFILANREALLAEVGLALCGAALPRSAIEPRHRPVGYAIDRIAGLSPTPATLIGDVDGVGDRQRLGSMA